MLTPLIRLQRAAWWGGPAHKIFTVLVFIILASLDNTARGVLIPLYAIIGRSLNVSEVSLGAITSLNTLIIAITAILWGYWGDRTSRKPLLLYGTAIWTVAMAVSGLAQTYAQLLSFQLISAVGIGCIASVGFSVISDFIPPRHRGLALSVWGLSQGGAAGIGALLGGSIGAYNWTLPFFLVAGAGVFFALLYLFTFEPERGRAEPELASVFAAGDSYPYRIQREDIKQIFSIGTNRWLLLQAFIAPLGFGARVWMSRLFIAKVEAAGYSLETATVTGNMLSLLFETGFYFAIVGGYLGDRWQRRNPRGRAYLATIGMLAPIPFQIVIPFMPIRDLAFPENGNLLALTIAVGQSIVSNPWVTSIFVVALFGIALASIDLPNRTALFTDVNLPEHRGTIAGLIIISAGTGLALGNWLAGLTFAYLATHFPSPLNFELGMAIFQIFFIPAAYCYYRVTKTAGSDIEAMRTTLKKRAEQPSISRRE